MANIIEKAEDYVSSATISREMLRDKLSEFLAVERGGLKLYDEAVRIVTDPQVSKQFEVFRDQTRRHESILMQVMEQLGLDPRYLSPAAKVAQQKANGLLSTMTSPDGFPSKAAEINAIENIVLAETKDHADWEMLGKIARQSDDSRLRDVLKPVVSEVEQLAIGDLHIDSFGTWRDAEGRLAWDVDDFDESYPLSYTNDLVRLAASVKIAIDAEMLSIGFKEACDAILNGYRDTINNEGCPFVLAEREANLERLGVKEIVFPEDFWQKLNKRRSIRSIPRVARTALEAELPQGLDYRVVRREAGTGSLGRQRFVAIGEWMGGYIAREAKAVTPSACVWLDGRKRSPRSYYEDAIEGAVRSRDPFQKIIKAWLVRRLSPDSNPIEIADWPAKRDERVLIHAMGCEAANVHLGTSAQIRKVLHDLHRRKSTWLRIAAKEMAKALEAEWKVYKQLQ